MAYSAVEVGPEHRRVVGVDRDHHAGVAERRDRVLVQRRHRPGRDVGRRAHLQRDARGGEVREQLRVLGGRRAVPDPLGAEQPDRVPDRLRAGGLPGVRDAAQPGGARGVEVRLELRAGYADLRATEAEADQRVRGVVQRVVQGRVGGRQSRLPRDVVDPAQHQPEVPLGVDPALLQRLGVGLDRDAPDHGGVRRAGQLGVPQRLALGHLAGDLVGQQPDVVGRADQVDDREVDLDEVREVAEREELLQRLRVAGHHAGVPLGELGDDARRTRSPRGGRAARPSAGRR